MNGTRLNQRALDETWISVKTIKSFKSAVFPDDYPLKMILADDVTWYSFHYTVMSILNHKLVGVDCLDFDKMDMQHWPMHERLKVSLLQVAVHCRTVRICRLASSPNTSYFHVQDSRDQGIP